MRVFITSDQHFGHKNVIKYEDRPFGSVEEMNAFMIIAWNEVVSKEDKVFVLGDFSFTTKDITFEIMRQLNGKKILIMGNHDKSHSIVWWKSVGFDEVYPYPIIYREFYILSHEPVYVNQHMPYINIHGHLHSKKMEDKFYYNIGVENHSYRPVLFDEILKDLEEN